MELTQQNQELPSVIYPEGTDPFPFQVSGHRHGAGRLKQGVLKHKSGHLVKPLLEDDRRSVLELAFYETVFQNNHSDPLLLELRRFAPAFHGTWTTNVNGKDVKYLCLEDICATFQSPSVLDVKLGRITYDRNATESKIIEQKNKYLFGEVTGIRIAGMKVYNDADKLYLTPEKKFLRQLPPDSLMDVLGMYLTSDAYINTWFLSGFIHKLQQLDDWFSKQRKFEFTASSVLFVYEGTLSSWSAWAQNNEIPNLCQLKVSSVKRNAECNSTSKFLYDGRIASNSEKNICDICGICKNTCYKVLTNCSLFRLSMIDFAHCYPSDKEDANYIFGLKNLIAHFKDLLKLQTERSLL